VEINRIGIVGAGTMGSGIAQVCALAELEVILVDNDSNALHRARTSIEAGTARMVSKGKATSELAKLAGERIKFSQSMQSLSSADFLIEAATENFDTKQAILRQLEMVAMPTAIIATNTSSVSITKLAAVLSDPSRLVGMHFFNPVPVMDLVEIIGGMQTGDSAIHTTERLVARLGKTPINVKNSPGFVVNRVLVPMINEAIFVCQEGLSTAKDIDKGLMLGANHPIGPLALADLIGLDTVLAIMEIFYRDFNDSKYRPAPLLRQMVDAGLLGRKTGCGFYQY
jgi:3-hydroxybutyryl-CoA dehydrogenase